MRSYRAVYGIIIIFLFALNLAGIVTAATFINLNTADNFSILAGSTITNTGSSVINGDMGLSPGSSITGFPPGTINGTQHVSDATAIQAKTDLDTAYSNASGQTPNTTIATELGGTTKGAGIYDSADGTFGITGTLTLDAAGNPDAVFIFKTTTTLITAAASNIVLINAAQSCNIFWQVGSSATLGANSTFKGNILAFTSITLGTGANVEGRVLARGAAVTLDTNNITPIACLAPPTPPLIHLLKTPSSFTVPYNGNVVFTYTVTNPGTVELNNVSVIDDKCNTILGPTGDTNSNNLLEPSETWVYTCQMNLTTTTTTTNTATAQGSANGSTVLDFSVNTVNVTSLVLPSTAVTSTLESKIFNIILIGHCFYGYINSLFKKE
ncbi:MAG: ice-binding family protein [Candidatus Dojkabacteria bacterium]